MYYPPPLNTSKQHPPLSINGNFGWHVTKGYIYDIAKTWISDKYYLVHHGNFQDIPLFQICKNIEYKLKCCKILYELTLILNLKNAN